MSDDWKSATCDTCAFMVMIRRFGGRYESGDCRFGPPTPTPNNMTRPSRYPEVTWTTPACAQYQRSAHAVLRAEAEGAPV